MWVADGIFRQQFDVQFHEDTLPQIAAEYLFHLFKKNIANDASLIGPLPLERKAYFWEKEYYGDEKVTVYEYEIRSSEGVFEISKIPKTDEAKKIYGIHNLRCDDGVSDDIFEQYHRILKENHKRK